MVRRCQVVMSPIAHVQVAPHYDINPNALLAERFPAMRNYENASLQFLHHARHTPEKEKTAGCSGAHQKASIHSSQDTITSSLLTQAPRYFSSVIMPGTFCSCWMLLGAQLYSVSMNLASSSWLLPCRINACACVIRVTMLSR